MREVLQRVRAKLAECVCDLMEQEELWDSDLETAARLMIICGRLSKEQQRQNQLDAIDDVLQWKGTGKGRVETIKELKGDSNGSGSI